MTAPPDRIWLDWPEANRGDPVFDPPPENSFQAAQTCYVRLAMLSDPNAVHLNMLRGTIAKPSLAQIAHIYGDEWTASVAAAEARARAEADYFGSLVSRARIAAAKASIKFPQPNYVTLKIAEEAGEVVRGAVHYAEGRMEWSEVEGEIVQLVAMLIRFVTEGDQVNGVTPPPADGGDT